MEEATNNSSSSKTTVRINRCTYRRLNIEHEFNERARLQSHLSKLNSYKQQEEKFNKKLKHLRKSLAQIQPYSSNEINDEESSMTPNCFARIQNHFRLLNFSSDTEKRLLCQAPSYNKSTKSISPTLPYIPRKKNSKEIDQCIRRISFYQSRPPQVYSCRSPVNEHFSTGDLTGEKRYRAYIEEQKSYQILQRDQNDQRKTDLLYEFDQLKHSINDPHSTLSVLAALSRAFLFLEIEDE